ncbi:unnamed protein product [Linum trigynum]|uniref:Uncharacterized protein n=1 Tax=Linum trigynum TaxID=586398 RepID=A0AAV2FAC7_9ROSI
MLKPHILNSLLSTRAGYIPIVVEKKDYKSFVNINERWRESLMILIAKATGMSRSRQRSTAGSLVSYKACKMYRRRRDVSKIGL